MSLPLRLSEPASAELSEAVRWYEARRLGLGAELLEAVDQTFGLIEQHPEIGTPVPVVARGRLRRLLVQRFPYHVIYDASAQAIVVVAVAHARRRPDYWRDRL